MFISNTKANLKILRKEMHIVLTNFCRLVLILDSKTRTILHRILSWNQTHKNKL